MDTNVVILITTTLTLVMLSFGSNKADAFQSSNLVAFGRPLAHYDYHDVHLESSQHNQQEQERKKQQRLRYDRIIMRMKSRHDNSRNEIGRRGALSYFLNQAAVVGAILPISTQQALAATDPLFQKNPLTNSVFEKLRIWDQNQADNIVYGGELAPGSPRGQEAYAKLLVPILSIQSDLEQIDDLVHQPDGTGLSKSLQILQQPYFSKTGFKKTFNAFADNIYYSDPDRANLYLAGGATPKNEQTLAYLLRNDILNNLDALVAEVEYLIKVQKKIEIGEEKGPLDTDDLYNYIKNSNVAMVKYINLVPPTELKLGRELLSQRSS